MTPRGVLLPELPADGGGAGGRAGSGKGRRGPLPQHRGFQVGIQAPLSVMMGPGGGWEVEAWARSLLS